MSSNDELSSDTSSSCDIKSLQLAVGGKALLIRSFSAIVEEGDVTEETEDDEDGIRLVTLESPFENEETVLNR